jgi:hypothetical protein
MQIVEDATHRVLAYIDALNRHGIKPPAHFVDKFAEEPDQRMTTISQIPIMQFAQKWSTMFGEHLVADENFTNYISRLGWATLTDGRIELTGIGRALLKSLNTPAIEEAASDVFEIVLHPDDPFAYAQAIGALASVNQGLLIEPYFRLQQLMDIADLGNIDRVLLGSNLKPQEYEILATGLAALPETRRIEVRRAKDLHDRYLIPWEDGSALMLGMSLGGIGKKVSTLTTLGAVASRALRAAHKEIWQDAEILEPRKVATGSDASQAVPAKKAVSQQEGDQAS